MSKENPEKFADLDADLLYTSALEDFALPATEEDKGKKKALLALFTEYDIKWADYLARHPEIAPPAEPEVPENVVTSTDVTGAPNEPVEEVRIVTASAPKPNVKEKYLMKMVRDNPRIDFPGRVSFTQEHPYQLVDEEMADYLLTKETGFRQATPGELREFYG
jgi:hypothetical protein